MRYEPHQSRSFIHRTLIPGDIILRSRPGTCMPLPIRHFRAGGNPPGPGHVGGYCRLRMRPARAVSPARGSRVSARDDETSRHSRAGGNPPGPEHVLGSIGYRTLPSTRGSRVDARDDETYCGARTPFCHSRAGGNPPGPEHVGGYCGLRIRPARAVSPSVRIDVRFLKTKSNPKRGRKVREECHTTVKNSKSRLCAR